MFKTENQSEDGLIAQHLLSDIYIKPSLIIKEMQTKKNWIIAVRKGTVNKTKITDAKGNTEEGNFIHRW